ncbi:uncharacterized protein pbxip1a [Hippocampus zosterae]|uniref:uncharacterized protein pbxip1a n=1 Tax=Hippocampus zosterae TaxID=109293 RepID=UPI00223E7BB7|nr:uncharacterized protein pbxip1a [Hippocampus zosterae]
MQCGPICVLCAVPRGRLKVAMSDHGSSTGSSGSSTNSWTLLSPEEAAVDNGGAPDDGTESLGDAPSLSEDAAAGGAGEVKPSDIPVECVLSEEGHQRNGRRMINEARAGCQVCQESSPESGDGHALCRPLRLDRSDSPAPAVRDPPAGSPCDEEHPGAALVSGPDFAEPDETFREADGAVADEPEPSVIPVQTVAAWEPPRRGDAEVDRERPEAMPGSGLADDVKAAESLGSMRDEDEEEEDGPPEFDVQEEGGEGPAGHGGDGPRRRTLRSGLKATQAEEELDWWPAERKEKGRWWASRRMAGAAALLFLGVLFLCGHFDHFDAGDVSHAQQSQKAADAGGFFLTRETSAEFPAVPDTFDTDGSGHVGAGEMRTPGDGPSRRQPSRVIKEAREDADKVDGKKSREGPGQKGDGGNPRGRVREHPEKIWREEERERRHEREAQKPRRRPQRQERRKDEPRGRGPDDLARFWRAQEHKLRRPGRPPPCASVEDCAARESLFPVRLADFQELLEGYLDKLEGSPAHSKDVLRRLVADFFDGDDGVFPHHRRPFAEFAEDVADILEDMADAAEGADEALEEAMEEFSREALWKFAAAQPH